MKVIFADFSIALKRLRESEDCKHKHIVVDSNGGIVECEDCKKQLDPIWALNFLAAQWGQELAKLNKEKEQARAVVSDHIHTKAAQTAEAAWRSRTMVPACPHCGRGIFASDGFGRSQVSAAIERRRREAKG